jgi:hypothetical protein
MYQADKEKLMEVLADYPVKEIMEQLSGLVLKIADEAVDSGNKERAKELVQFSVALDDLIAGRPFLV